MEKFLEKLKVLFEKIKVIWKKEAPHASEDSKFIRGKGSFRGMDTQNELKEFQSKQQPSRPQATADDLSQVLDDVLRKPSGSPDQGLYSGKKK